MHYDLAGRLTSKDYHTGATPAQGGTVIPVGTLESTDTFSYDAASRLTATTKGRHNISTEHTYAADSMPLTEKLVADGRTYESTRTYDAANRPLTHTFPNGKNTHWAYTARNLVASIHYEDKLVAGQNYDAGYRLTSQTYGNGLVRTISYGRQDNLRTADSVATKDDLQMTYSYAADKQITAESIAEDVLANTSFTASYDAGNRITNWSRAGAPVNNAQSWNYDDNGNWISTTKDGTTEARNHDDTDQLTQIAGKAAINDAKGNLTEYEINGKEYEVDYDLDNRIIKVDVDNNDVEYRYDALGRRVIRQEGTTKTALIWWGNSENAEHKHQAGQTVIQNDIMAHPSRLNSVIARAVDGSKFKLEWYHKNYLDHVYAVSDDSGDILEHYRYTAFGEVTIYDENGAQVTTTQIDNHILWNTRRRDEVTGYYMYKFRHYSAELGRWLARDPIEEKGGVNLYAFVGNEPVGRWDRLGLVSMNSLSFVFEFVSFTGYLFDETITWEGKTTESFVRKGDDIKYSAKITAKTAAHYTVAIEGQAGVKILGNGGGIKVTAGVTHELSAEIGFEFSYSYSASEYLYETPIYKEDLYSGNVTLRTCKPLGDFETSNEREQNAISYGDYVVRNKRQPGDRSKWGELLYTYESSGYTYYVVSSKLARNKRKSDTKKDYKWKLFRKSGEYVGVYESYLGAAVGTRHDIVDYVKSTFR